MPRPDCPRCGSDLVVAAASATPSDSVLELRSGVARVGVVEPGADHWLCRMCGHQWDAAADRDGAPDADDAREPARVGAANPAAELRQARERRGRSLSDVATGTRIQERHLRALERDAPLEEFPSPAYARFFLREYAEYLRLDPAPLLREFEARHAPAEEEPPIAPPAPRRAPRAGWRVFAIVSTAALVTIALLPAVLRSREPTRPPPASPAPSAAHDSGRELVPAPPAREPNGVRAALHLDAASWVQAVADGEVLEASTLEPGTVVAYRAHETLRLTLGNAGGVRLRVNGEPVVTGGSGEVVTFDLTWHDGEVLTERA